MKQRRDTLKRRGGRGSEGFPRTLEKLLLRMHETTEIEPFVQAAFKVMQAAAPSDRFHAAYRYSTFDAAKVRWVDSRGIHEIDDAFAARHFQLNPGIPILAANPGLKLLRLCDCYPSEAAMLASDFYKECMTVMDFHYAVVLLFWLPDAQMPPYSLSLHRTAQESEFTDAEIATLWRLHPQLEAGLRRIEKLQAERAARRGLEEIMLGLALPTLLLDWQLRVLYCNDAARELCARWEHGEAARQLKAAGGVVQVPGDLLGLCRELCEKFRCYGGSVPMASEGRHRTDQALRAVARLMPLKSGSMSDPVVRLQLFADGAGGDGAPRPERCELKPRDRELVRLVCEGWSNQEIADTLGRTVSTVKVELHTLFKRLDVSSRTRLMALMR